MSLHADAVTTLEWVAPTPQQDALRGRYLAHLAGHPDGCYRTSFPDHLTAGTLVIDDSGEHVLLNLHGKARRWFAFGGHCETTDATLAGVALREAVEESGIAALRFDSVPAHLDQHGVAFCDPRGVVQHLDVRYVAQAPPGSRVERSDESLDVRWWPVTDLPELEPEMLTLIEVARQRFS